MLIPSRYCCRKERWNSPFLYFRPNGNLDNSSDIARTSFNGNDEADSQTGNGNETPSKKVPPKTLPKPKVRPVPPPKPKKSAVWVPPPIIGNSFQDEGADGSEV